MKDTDKNNKPIVKIAIALIVIGLIVFLINKFNIFKDYGPNEIKAIIQGKGALAPLIYVALLSSLPLLLFPDSVIVLAGGMIFGVFWGSILTLTGSLLGATIAFFISRKLGKEAVERFVPKKLVLFDENDKKKGFFIILMLRLIPLFPFKIVSYSAGLSNIKYKDFAFATAVGSLPGILVYTNLGDKTTVAGSKDFYISIALLVGLIVFSLIAKKIISSREKAIEEV